MQQLHTTYSITTEAIINVNFLDNEIFYFTMKHYKSINYL
jgi:hypothetical protein